VWEAILWIAAVVFVIAGIWRLVLGEWAWGIGLIIIGLLIGPGGVSILS
jgi:TM2 domain-containing membrane protein YozV